MATDKSEPRTGLIVGLGLLSIATLISGRAGLQSYYIIMSEHEESVKILSQPHRMLEQVRHEEDERLERGDIQGAMHQVVGMMNARPAAIAPTQSADMGALQGWSAMPNPNAPVVVPPTAAAPAAPTTPAQPAPGGATTVVPAGVPAAAPAQAQPAPVAAPSAPAGGAAH